MSDIEMLEEGFNPVDKFIIPCALKSINSTFRYWYTDKEREVSIIIEHFVRLLKLIGKADMSFIRAYLSMNAHEAQVFLDDMHNRGLIVFCDDCCIRLSSKAEENLELDEEGRPYLTNMKLKSLKDLRSYLIIGDEAIQLNEHVVQLKSSAWKGLELTSGNPNVKEIFKDKYNSTALEKGSDRVFHSFISDDHEYGLSKLSIWIACDEEGRKDFSIGPGLPKMGRSDRDRLCEAALQAFSIEFTDNLGKDNTGFLSFKALESKFWSELEEGCSYQELVNYILNRDNSTLSSSAWLIMDKRPWYSSQEQFFEEDLGRLIANNVKIGGAGFWKKADNKVYYIVNSFFKWIEDLSKGRAKNRIHFDLREIANQDFEVAQNDLSKSKLSQEEQRLLEVLADKHLEFFFIPDRALVLFYHLNVGKVSQESPLREVLLCTPVILFRTDRELLSTMKSIFVKLDLLSSLGGSLRQ